MAVNFQLVMDCTDPGRLSRFWAAALRYELEPPPEGFATWDDYWRDVGVPEEDLGTGADRIIDPGGAGLLTAPLSGHQVMINGHALCPPLSFVRALRSLSARNRGSGGVPAAK